MSMHIQTPCSPGEVIDKITILEIKLAMMSDETKRKNLKDEHALLTEALESIVTLSPEVLALKDELACINRSIWDSEDAVRAHWNDDAKFLEGARNSHYMNDERAKVKRKINELLGSVIIEEKSHPKYEHNG
jgi:Family of unknown function (DUF6165)